MIHPEDEEALQRMLRVSELPGDVVEEYEMWLGMFHRGGASGPLGCTGLIAMLRHLGHAPEPAPAAAVTTDWRTVPTDGTARVKVITDTGEQEGAFVGFVMGGVLAIQFDGDPITREHPQIQVSLVGIVPHKPKSELSAAAQAMLDEPKPSKRPGKTKGVPVAA